MAKDGDRHVLGDPVTRVLRDPAERAPSLQDDTPPLELTDDELRREMANLDLVLREGPERGVAPSVLELAGQRLADLRSEASRRRVRRA